jgi:iron(III) transport system permease protein
MTFGAPPFNLYGTGLLVLSAYCVMFLPEASRAASAAVAQTNVELTEASHVFRAGPFRTFRRIVVPQVSRGVLAGWVVVFFLAVNEVTASSFLGGLHNPVVGHVAIEYFTTGRMSEVAAVTLIVTVITATVVLCVARLFRRADAG